MDDKLLIDYNVDVPLPALLRVARRTYGMAIKEVLLSIGCEDMPHNGIYVIGGIARTGTPLEALVRQLGVSKQAASQLVDALVNNGYIERSIDPKDRRRLNVTLTERGKLAASASRLAVEKIDAELTEAVSEEYLSHTKTTLATLIDINDRRYNLPRGKR